MREYITPERIANQIRLRRSDRLETFLIVEGRSDKLVYERFVDSTKCEFSIASSKDNAIGALDILEKDSFKGVLAIVGAVSRCTSVRNQRLPPRNARLQCAFSISCEFRES